jgi:hypothetical protein
MKTRRIALGATIAGLFTVLASLIAAPDHKRLVIFALVLALLSLSGSLAVIAKSRPKLKWAFLLAAIPVSVFAVDNFGRLPMIMNLGGFRILKYEPEPVGTGKGCIHRHM